MASSAELAIWLKMHGADQVKSQMDDVSTKAGHFGKALGDVSKIASGFVMGSALMQAPDFFMSAAQDAADEAAAIARLQQAVENTGAAWGVYNGKMEAVVQQGMKLGFADDDTRSALALLTAQTGSAEEAMSRFSLAQDLSRGATIDLVTASKLLGKVTDENVNVLARYGIKAQEGMDQTELFGLLQQKFGGQAEAFGKSAAGQMASAKIAMQELKESIGYAVLPVLTKFTSWLNENQDLIQRVLDQGIRKAGEAAETLGDAFQQARPDLESAFELMQEGFDTIKPALQWILDNKVAMAAAFTLVGAAAILAFTPITAPVLAVIAVLVGLMIAIGYLRENWDSIQAKTLEVWNAISTFLDEKLPYLKEVIVSTFNVIKTDVETAITLVRDVIRIVMALLHGDWSAAWDGLKTLVSDTLTGIYDSIVARMGLLGDVMRMLGTGMLSAFTGVMGGLGNAITGILDAGIHAAVGFFNSVVLPTLNSIIRAYNMIPFAPDIPEIGPIGVGGSYQPAQPYSAGLSSPGTYVPTPPGYIPPPAPGGKMGGAYGPTSAGASFHVYNPTFVYQGSAREALEAMGAAL